MKIRTDYVSNSSSSSFIVVLSKDYDFKKFVKDVALACVDNPDWDGYTKNMFNEIKGRNIRNLDYCLNTYELLFLGTFRYGYTRGTIKGKKKVADFVKHDNWLKENCPNMFNTNVVSQTEGKLVVDFPLIASGATATYEVMDSTIRRWQCHDENDKKLYKEVVKEIEEFVSSQMECECSSGLFEVTMNTIYNTEALLSERKADIKLDKWCSDLKNLKKMISDGNRIFGIDVHHSGDGEGPTSIFAVSGWDSNAFKYANVRVLDCECG